jgi:preprotein translocase subunit SecA
LAALDHLRQGIHLRGYAQKNPKQEYKREAFELFESMLTTIRDEVTGMLMTVRIAPAELAEIGAPAVEPTAFPETETAQVNVQYMQAAFEAQGPAVERVGRNDACPCGSGKKYKHCHGKLS